MLGAGDSERVAALMRETAAAELLPRFRRLAKDDIRHKRPGDVVTVADVVSEQRLASGLARILPGVPVVGEEAVENDAGLIELIVCLVHDRETIAGWILDVPGDRMAAVTKGQGVRLDDQPIRLETKGRPPSGYIGFKVRKEFDRQLSAGQRARLGGLTSLNCAGREYIEILSGQREFSLYRRTKPWDHAAGALMVGEAGGQAERFDGTPYGPAGSMDGGIITAVSAGVLTEVREILEAVQMPLLAPRS